MCIRDRARLLLVGEGGLMEQVKEKAAALGVLEQVIFTGNQGKVSDCLLYTSRCV